MDSPLIAGKFFREIDLTAKGIPPHFMDIVADSAAALEVKAETIQHFARLGAETGALFGARHFRSYRFLVTLSDEVGDTGWSIMNRATTGGRRII